VKSLHLTLHLKKKKGNKNEKHRTKKNGLNGDEQRKAPVPAMDGVSPMGGRTAKNGGEREIFEITHDE